MIGETFIGGKARNMHAEKHARRITGTGYAEPLTVFFALNAYAVELTQQDRLNEAESVLARYSFTLRTGLS